MIKPFHLSLVVPSLDEAKEFYINLLGCKMGRDSGKWIDIIFFGHQITLHQERDTMVAMPIDHFGAILDKQEWNNISGLFSSHGVKFEMRPSIKEEGTDTESGKFIVKDPADNVLEFKYYVDFNTTFNC